MLENEGEPHIRNVLRPSIVHQFLLQAWVGWMQLYVNAKVIEKQSAVERYMRLPPKLAKLESEDPQGRPGAAPTNRVKVRERGETSRPRLCTRCRGAWASARGRDT